MSTAHLFTYFVSLFYLFCLSFLSTVFYKSLILSLTLLYYIAYFKICVGIYFYKVAWVLEPSSAMYWSCGLGKITYAHTQAHMYPVQVTVSVSIL